MISNQFSIKNDLINLAKKSKLLKKDEEYKLINQWKKNKDQESIKIIISAYLRLILSIARKYSSYGLPLEDLINEGIIGIMHSLDKFDISKNYRLSTYASWWIRASIQDYILKNWSIVRNGTTAAQKTLFFSLKKIKRKINDLSYEYMGYEELKTISVMLNIKPEDVQNMEAKLSGGDVYLNQTFDSEENNEIISLFSDNSLNPEEITKKNIDGNLKTKWLNEALNRLKDREKIIINARKLQEKAITLEELGKKLNISKERVRQIEDKALIKLQKDILKISNQSKNFFINN